MGRRGKTDEPVVTSLFLASSLTGAAHPRFATMLALMALSSLSALLFVYIFMPALWLSIMSIDESLDAHESGLALVASRNPFRETGPPANMAKLILLRHKIQTTNRKRRSNSHPRQAPRTFVIPSHSNPKPSWMRFGKPFGGKQHH